MANRQPSIILHLDSLEILDKLTVEQSAELFKAIRDYNQGKELELSPIVDLIFTPFKNQFDRNLEKYDKVCKRNQENGKKGGRPKNPDNPDGSSITQKNPDNLKKKNKNKKKNNTTILESYDPKDRFVVNLIMEHRQEMKKPITKRGIDSLLKKLNFYAVHNKITFKEALDFWLGENWQGIDIEYKYSFRKAEQSTKSFAQIAHEMPNPWDEQGNLIEYDNNGNQIVNGSLEILQ
jgi:hypothetical protein